MKQFYTTLMVLKSHKDRALVLLNQNIKTKHSNPHQYHYDEGGQLFRVVKTSFSDEVEVCTLSSELSPYGLMPSENELKEHGIPYTKMTDHPGSTNYVQKTLRFTHEGIPVVKSEAYRDRFISPGELREAIDLFGEADPHLAIHLLRQKLSDIEHTFNPLPWTNQERYSARYRTKRLIGYEKQ